MYKIFRARVLIVDDSRVMRALFSGLLERAPLIDVVGTASDADDARAQIADCKPNVLTLDIEMPGTSGLEFLSEVMATNPMPVIMLSTSTQKGAATSDRAMELGAAACFPKPLRVTPEEFDGVAAAFAKLVVKVAKGPIPRTRATRAVSSGAKNPGRNGSAA